MQKGTFFFKKKKNASFLISFYVEKIKTKQVQMDAC